MSKNPATEENWNTGGGLVVFMDANDDDDPGWAVLSSDLPCIPRVGDMLNLRRWPHNPDAFHHAKVTEVCFHIRPQLRTTDIYYQREL